MGWGDGFASGLRAGTSFGSTLVSTYKAGAKDRAIGEAEDAYKKAIENAQGLEGTAREEAIRTAESNRRDAYLGSNRYSNGMSAGETLRAIDTIDKGPAALNAASAARNDYHTGQRVDRANGNGFFGGRQEAIPTGQALVSQNQEVMSPEVNIKGQSMGLLNAAMNGNQEAQTLMNDAASLYGGGSLTFGDNKVGWKIGDQEAPLDMNTYANMYKNFYGIGSAYAKFGR